MAPNVCRVCGCSLPFFPWGEDGNCPSFDFCPCCGIEFGVEDLFYERAKQVRNAWLAAGAKWVEESERPLGWNLAEQLENILYGESLREALSLLKA